MEVLPAEFARQAGVTRQSICAKIKKGTLIQNSAGKLDTENPVNAGYLAMKRRQIVQRFLINRTIRAVVFRQAAVQWDIFHQVYISSDKRQVRH